MKTTSIFALACLFSLMGYLLFSGSSQKKDISQANTIILKTIDDTQDTSAKVNDLSNIKRTEEEEYFEDEEDLEDYFRSYQTEFKGTTHKNELNFLVLGDFGYVNADGPFNGAQELADLVYNRVKKSFVHYDFMVSVGDVLYPFGVESFDDPKPYVLFEDTYKMSQLGLDWYSALGNHDCMGDLPATYALAEQFSYWKQSEPYYYKIFNIGDSHLKTGFVFLNGCDLVCLRKDSSECYRGTYKNINWDNIQDQIDWLEEVLYMMSQDESIAWKIIVLHYGIFSAGEVHGDNQDLKDAILPLLVKYNVDLVLSGHDHSVQYLRMDLNLSSEDAVNKVEENINCPEEVNKNQCMLGEFFYYELTPCGISKKEDQLGYKQTGYLQSKMHPFGLEDTKFARETVSNQYEYLHQFVIGTGGKKVQNMCPMKQKDSIGQLRYGNTVLGLGDIKIREDRIDVKLLSLDNEVLYSVKIFRHDVDSEDL